MVGAQQAAQAQHGLADYSQVLAGFRKTYALAGLDLFRKSPDEHAQQGDLIPEDDPFRGF